MSRVNFGVEKGLDLFAENGDLRISLLQGTLAPDGTSGDQGAAPIGSLYARSGTGELYQKIANAGAAGDWSQFGIAEIGNFRKERVDILTNDLVSAGTFDPTTLSDNDSGVAAGDLTVGHYIIGDADGTPGLFEITNISAPNVTVVAADPGLVASDMFGIKFYLPDPNGQENQAIATFSGGVFVKVADVDFATATGVSLSGSYAASAGDPLANDSVEQAIAKLDGNNDATDSAIGISQGDTNLGTLGATYLADNTTVRQGLLDIDAQVATNAGDISTNAGNISTNAGDIAANTADIADIRTLTGTADGETDYGLFSNGDILTDSSNGKALYDEIDVELTRQRGKTSAAAVTAVTTIDSVLVDSVAASKWIVTIEDVATPANKKHLEVFAGHNGSASNDASGVDDTISKILRLGANFDADITVDLSGSGAAQVMRLRVASAEVSGVNVYAKRVENLF